MAYARIAHVVGQSPNSNSFTTSGIDTTGADLIVVLMGSIDGIASPVLTDSKSNTWTGLTEKIDAGNMKARLYYCRPSSVGSGHTFTATQGSSFPVMCVSAYSGSVATPFDAENGSTGSATTRQAGSITPSETNELVVAAICYDGASAMSIDGGFTIQDQAVISGGNAFGAGLADLIQTSIAAANPTWTLGGTQHSAAVIASFKDTPSGASSPTYPQLERGIRGLNRGVAQGSY